MVSEGRGWLLAAGGVSFAVALLHVVVVLIGPSAYSFFGGERMARLAAANFAGPALQTLTLAAIHSIFGVYALSGAGVIRRLPLLAGVLFVIGGIYAFRGLSIIEQGVRILADPNSTLLMSVIGYSFVSFVTGCAYIIGTVKRWDWFSRSGGSANFSA